MASLRIPTADQLGGICIQTRRYIDVRRRRLGGRTDLVNAESHAMLRLKEVLTTSEANCPHGWPDPVHDDLDTLWRAVHPPEGCAVGGTRPRLEYGPSGMLRHIPGRSGPISSGSASKSVAQLLADLDALEAAVAELERAISGVTVDASRAAASLPDPDPVPTPERESGDDAEVWGKWFSCDMDVLGRAMGLPRNSRVELVVDGMVTKATIEMRPVTDPTLGDWHEWEFRIKDVALREKVLKYIATEMSEREIVTEFRKQGRTVDANFVEAMIGRNDASIDEVSLTVYGEQDEKENALKSSRYRLNKFMESKGLKIRYKVSSTHVFKTVSHE